MSTPATERRLTGADARRVLEANLICVVATLLPDGTPHGSASHFAVLEAHDALCLSLHDRSATSRNLLQDGRMAVTVGVDPKVPETLQLRGHATVDPADCLHEAQGAFYARFPYTRRYRDDPHTVFAIFRPTWSRYSDNRSRREYFVRGFPAELLGSTTPNTGD